MHQENQQNAGVYSGFRRKLSGRCSASCSDWSSAWSSASVANTTWSARARAYAWGGRACTHEALTEVIVFVCWSALCLEGRRVQFMCVRVKACACLLVGSQYLCLQARARAARTAWLAPRGRFQRMLCEHPYARTASSVRVYVQRMHCPLSSGQKEDLSSSGPR
eukprot:366307-Chlamydomonas_euryale.AAC.6